MEEWIHQLLQQGLEVLRKDIHRIDDMATRAVDYGMPSIARRLRLIPTKIAEETEWIEFLSVELGQLLFLIDSIKILTHNYILKMYYLLWVCPLKSKKSLTILKASRMNGFTSEASMIRKKIYEFTGIGFMEYIFTSMPYFWILR